MVLSDAFNQVTLTAIGVNGLGNYTEMVASTAAPVTLMKVNLFSVAGTGNATSLLVNLATGTAGNEVVFCANLNAGYAASTPFGTAYWIPCNIPAGIRIAGNCQSLISADTVFATFATFSGTNRTPTAIDTLGAVTASSQGTTVACGTSGSEGSWIELVASTAQHYSGMMLGCGGAADATLQDSYIYIDVGVGASLSEVVTITNVPVYMTSVEQVFQWFNPAPRKVDIPVGSRLAVRAASSSASAQSIDVILYGFY
jgi:hypothetical protein